MGRPALSAREFAELEEVRAEIAREVFGEMFGWSQEPPEKSVEERVLEVLKEMADVLKGEG